MSHYATGRPPPGKQGALVKVRTNSFAIGALPRKNFFQYDIVFTPEVLSPRKAAEIIQRLQNYTRPDLFHPKAAFDGRRILYSSYELAIPGGSATYQVNLSDREAPPGSVVRSIVGVQISKAAVIKMGDLQNVLEGKPHSGTSMSALQVLNVLVRQAPQMSYPHKGRSFFTETGKSLIGAFEIWRGYFQSVRPSPGRVLVNIDISTGLMYAPGRLHEVAMKLLGYRNARDLEALHEGHRDWSKLLNFLKKVTVLLPPNANRRSNPKKGTIQGLVPAAGSHIFMRNEEPISVEQYFRAVKNIRLDYPRIPGVKTGRDAVVPFELCEIQKGQIYKKKAPPEYTSDVLKFSTAKPQERLKAITNGFSVLDYGNSHYVNQAEMAVSTQALEINGRVLAAQMIQYGNNDRLTVQKLQGSWNLLNRQFYTPSSIKSWSVICFDPQLPLGGVQSFVIGLANTLDQVGIKIANGKPPILAGNGQQAMDSQMVAAGTAAMKACGAPPTLIIVILPQVAPDIRKAVKRFGDTHPDMATPTQCIRADKLRKANDQYFKNVAMKINVKIGGINAIPIGPQMAWVMSAPTIVVGADVSHPAPGVLRPSVAALVSSVDQYASQYVASSTVQEPRLEIIADLKNMMKQAMKTLNGYQQYKTHLPNIWPRQILFFRDGVSEGEFHVVADSEVNHIKAAIDELWKERGIDNPKPKITFVIVGKRHHVRFFPAGRDPEGADKSGNCPAGLVVDTDITSPIAFDYFLQSHSGLLGTSRPSHYTVLRDENGFTADKLQELSYALCHCYARATRSVSIPAPVYYADIVCARADFHFDPNLQFMDDNSTGGQFNLQNWQSGFRHINPKQYQNMYFM